VHTVCWLQFNARYEHATHDHRYRLGGIDRLGNGKAILETRGGVVGIDNDMRAQFFGADASTKKIRDDLIATVRGYEHHDLDIRDASAVLGLFKQQRGAIDGIVHTASQPSHDWAARDPQTDFAVNANGTLNLLEPAREFAGT
jgi:nucleoside-diphosphate-sugar epimerase